MKTHYVMSFSGGICSWFAADLLIAQVGRANVTLLFADTKFEDADLYRFLDDVSTDWSLPIIRIAEGRTPWEVFFDNNYIGNSRVDLCSRILKRELLDRWTREHFSTRHTVRCVGLGYAERSRYIRFRARMRARGWKTEAPAMSRPYADKDFMLDALLNRGIEPPGLYADGFAHNNCGGFCVKQGIGGFVRLLHKRRDFYLYNEEQEQKLIQKIGKDVAILKDRTGGTVKPLTLRVLRERIEDGQLCSVSSDQGGCGCAVE